MKIPFLQIEPTTRCNYTCGFCAGRHMEQRDLTLAELEALLDGVEELEHVELQGEGEPLLHPQYFAMIAAIRRRFPHVGVSMVTNGSMFTPENIAALLDNRISRIFVSLESAEDEKFQAIRGGKLSRVKRGIAAFLEERNRRGLSQPTLGFAVTVLRSTREALYDSIAPLYRELGLDGGINVQPLQRMPQYASLYDADMQAELMSPDEDREFGARLFASPDLGALIQESQRNPGFYDRLYASTARRPVCPWLENGLYVGMDGVVVPCCYVKDSGRYGLGRVGDDMAIIGQRRGELARKLAAGQVPAGCTGCRLAHGLAAHATAARGSAARKNPPPG